jgi:hypothetical protein
MKMDTDKWFREMKKGEGANEMDAAVSDKAVNSPEASHLPLRRDGCLDFRIVPHSHFTRVHCDQHLYETWREAEQYFATKLYIIFLKNETMSTEQYRYNNYIIQ